MVDSCSHHHLLPHLCSSSRCSSRPVLLRQRREQQMDLHSCPNRWLSDSLSPSLSPSCYLTLFFSLLSYKSCFDLSFSWSRHCFRQLVILFWSFVPLCFDIFASMRKSVSFQCSLLLLHQLSEIHLLDSHLCGFSYRLCCIGLF